MNAKSFIKTFLENALVDFPNAIFKYAQNEYTNDHMIEVCPGNLLEDSKFIKVQTNLINEVLERYQEIVFFVSDYSLNWVENPEIIIKQTNLLT